MMKEHMINYYSLPTALIQFVFDYLIHVNLSSESLFSEFVTVKLQIK